MNLKLIVFLICSVFFSAKSSPSIVWRPESKAFSWKGSDVMSISIRNTLGKEVDHFNGRNGTQYTPDLPQGIYFASVVFTDHSTTTFKMLNIGTGISKYQIVATEVSHGLAKTVVGSVTVNPDVNKYVNNFKACNFHRSGLLSNPPKTIPTNVPGNNQANFITDAAPWHTGTLSEYTVVYNPPPPQLVQYLERLLPGFFYSYDSSSHLIKLISPNYAGSTREDSLSHNLTADVLVTLGRNKTVVNGFGSTLEYSSNDVTYVNNFVQMVDLRYRRIFNNGIVLGEVSYVYVVLNGRGDIIAFKMKWPSFNPVTTNQLPISLNSALEQVQTIYNSTISQGIAVDENGDKMSKSTITGCALGWRAIDDSTRIVISPAFSFEAQISVVNQSNVSVDHSFFIDVPALKKYNR